MSKEKKITFLMRASSLATGSSGCVSLLGSGLGGGLGRYQGQYGLISDNFISLNVVLANGKTDVVNASSHSDLFWAMKGVNFGQFSNDPTINAIEVSNWLLAAPF